MSVLLPAPLGPSRPMERPVSLAVSFLRIVRLPKRTSSPSNSITGSIDLFKRRCALRCSHKLREGNGMLEVAGDQITEAHAHEVAAGRDADFVRFAVGGDHGGFHIAEVAHHAF